MRIAGRIVEQVDYTYDAFDRRIAKAVDPDGEGRAQAEIERFVYDGEHIALTFDGKGQQTHRYLYGPQIDQVLADETVTGAVQWALSDPQGSVRDVINSQGQILNHIRYDSFGNITSQTNANMDFRFGYTGREFDEETGLYYYRARYYDASIGRFISEDPMDFRAGDSNLYRYVGNSATNYTDPSGEFAIAYPAGLAAAFAVSGTLIILSLSLQNSSTDLGSASLPEIDSGPQQRQLEEIIDALQKNINRNQEIYGGLAGKGLNALQDLVRDRFNINEDELSDEDILNIPGIEEALEAEDNCNSFQKPPFQKGKTPRNNEVQNKQFEDALKEINKKLDKPLSRNQQRRLHDEITKQGLGFRDIIQKGLELFRK